MPGAALDDRKRLLREQMRRLCEQRARERGDEPALALAARAVRSLAEAPEHRGLRSAALFAALPDELPTRPLFDWLRGEGARALLPRVVASPGGSRLEFAEVRAWEELAPGRYGLREPPRASSDLGLSAVDLIVVPGLAFDADGGRLGRGRGMYDRALGALDASTRAPVFGWAYTFQVVDAVPCGRHDQRVDGVVTESGLHRAGRAGVEAERHDERRKDDER